jgi:hypothetical protein
MSINASTAHMVEKLPIAFLERIPGLEPPAGLVSNFDDPPSLATTVVAVISVSLFFMLAAVGLRAYSKTKSAKAPTLDDCEYYPLEESIEFCINMKDRYHLPRDGNWARFCFLEQLAADSDIDRWARWPIVESRSTVSRLHGNRSSGLTWYPQRR